MKRSLRVLLPLIVLAVAGLLTYLMIKSRSGIESTAREIVLPLVRIADLAPMDHQFIVHAQGTVAPRTEINLVAEVSGRVVRVAESFTEGGFFEAGDVLLELDPRDYELAVVRAQAHLAEAKVNLEREQAEADVARQEWETLGRGEPGPLLLREPQLAEARARVASARAALAATELDLDRSRVQAPFAGRVRRKHADVGQFLGRGEVVARVYAIDYVEIRLPLSLEDLAYLDLPLQYRGETADGDNPTVQLRGRLGGRDHTWSGRIVRTEGEIDPRTRMLTAVARVDDPYARGKDSSRPPLSVGLFVHADIAGRSVDQVHIAPRAALRLDQRLMVVDRADRLRFRVVEILRIEGDRVVFRDGIEQGDRVCVSPLEIAVEGMEVRIAGRLEHPTDSGGGGTL